MILTQRHLELDGKTVISHFTFEPPLIAAADLDNTACFIFPINTQGKLYRADGKTEVQDSEGVLMKCGTYVNKWYATQENEVAEVVILRLYPTTMSSIIDPSTVVQMDQPISSSRTNTVVSLDVLLTKYLESLFFYFENPSLATEDLVSLKLKELTMLLINSKMANPIKELMSTLFYREQYSLQSIIQANLFEDVSLDEIAAIANMSVSTFKRKFKAEFQTTFTRYVMDKRLEKGKNLLVEKSTSAISEIAYDCGFNDPAYFTKSFKKKFGKSPSAFRNVKLSQTILGWK